MEVFLTFTFRTFSRAFCLWGCLVIICLEASTELCELVQGMFVGKDLLQLYASKNIEQVIEIFSKGET